MTLLSSKAPISSIIRGKEIFELMEKDFGFPIKDRLVIIPEVEMYRIKEDESIYTQAKKEKFEYQVFFDGEFVCFVRDTEPKDYVRINILKGLARLYKEGKIHWNKFLYEVEKQKAKKEEKDKQQDLDTKLAKLDKTPEERVVKEAIKKHLTKSNGRN